MTSPGLCGGCQHARVVGNRRGSTFWLCGRAAGDPRYPRYPTLPVLRCPGFAPRPTPESAAPGGPAAMNP